MGTVRHSRGKRTKLSAICCAYARRGRSGPIRGQMNAGPRLDADPPPRDGPPLIDLAHQPASRATPSRPPARAARGEQLRRPVPALFPRPSAIPVLAFVTWVSRRGIDSVYAGVAALPGAGVHHPTGSSEPPPARGGAGHGRAATHHPEALQTADGIDRSDDRSPTDGSSAHQLAIADR